jgi:DNA-binding NtrC family response regulator
MSRILIADDVPAMRQQYAYDLERLGGHATLTAASGAEAVQILETEPIDCVILDLEMPGVDGFEVLKTIQQRRYQVPVIVYTGTGNFERCVRAVKLGAYSFLAKDEPLERVSREVENALTWNRLTQEVTLLRRRTGQDSPLIGESAGMLALKERIARLAAIPSPVLVAGESGSGKELVARQLHQSGPRAAKAFIPINCAALQESLIESELFGHERGAFTGAERTRQGAFETASGGTLFLDEIGELPLNLQGKLLRVLEDGKIARVGATKSFGVDVRVIAATNRDLDAEAGAGRFREDLLFRLNVHTLRVPPLRERMDDLPRLVEHLLDEICQRFGRRRLPIAPAAVQSLQRCQWRRNNVRELRNVLERMIIACEGNSLDARHVPTDIQDSAVASAAEAAEAAPPSATGTLKDLKAAAERRIILAALESHQWHITKTAAALGLSDHASLLKIMRRHGLKRR